jgi:hypothetical protein
VFKKRIFQTLVGTMLSFQAFAQMPLAGPTEMEGGPNSHVWRDATVNQFLKAARNWSDAYCKRWYSDKDDLIDCAGETIASVATARKKLLIYSNSSDRDEFDDARTEFIEICKDIPAGFGRALNCKAMVDLYWTRLNCAFGKLGNPECRLSLTDTQLTGCAASRSARTAECAAEKEREAKRIATERERERERASQNGQANASSSNLLKITFGGARICISSEDTSVGSGPGCTGRKAYVCNDSRETKRVTVEYNETKSYVNGQRQVTLSVPQNSGIGSGAVQLPGLTTIGDAFCSVRNYVVIKAE